MSERRSWDALKLAQMRDKLAKVRRERDNCRAALELVQWEGGWSDLYDCRVCPNCASPPHAGHLQWCAIGRALGTARPIVSPPDSEPEPPSGQA